MKFLETILIGEILKRRWLNDNGNSADGRAADFNPA